MSTRQNCNATSLKVTDDGAFGISAIGGEAIRRALPLMEGRGQIFPGAQCGLTNPATLPGKSATLAGKATAEYAGATNANFDCD